uniref:Uncharacterized protein n=1 Tax=Rhizophora mucronata TaxID=61149 RepID=A0A2P2ILQ8_RHIMU
MQIFRRRRFRGVKIVDRLTLQKSRHRKTMKAGFCRYI